MKAIIICTVLVAVASRALGFSSGAPKDACDDMVPQHHVAPQKSAAPYTIKASKQVVKAGQPVEVIITGNSAKDTIKGFLLQARQGDKPIGQFKVAPSDRFSTLLDCGTRGNAVTHKKHSETDDKRSLTHTWISPKDFKGEVTFRATIALNGGVFWVGLESNPVKIQ